jgi:hypothetical protein
MCDDLGRSKHQYLFSIDIQDERQVIDMATENRDHQRRIRSYRSLSCVFSICLSLSLFDHSPLSLYWRMTQATFLSIFAAPGWPNQLPNAIWTMRKAVVNEGLVAGRGLP